jgi:hypothetical protein
MVSNARGGLEAAEDLEREVLSRAGRGRPFKITMTRNEHQRRPSDLEDRVFVAIAPNRLSGGGHDICGNSSRLGLRGLHHRCI